MKLAGKKTLITGAASGIGAAIVRLFAREGSDVAINYHTRRDAAEALADEARSLGVNAVAIQADVSEPEPVERMVAETVASLGGIDILVCSSGINHQSTLAEMALEDFDRMIKISLRSIFLCNKAVLPHFLRQGHGRIINVTSQLGQIGGINCAHYAAAKAGIIGFTKSLARELGPSNITANCIAPGPIETDFFFDGTTREWRDEKLASLPLGRFGRVEEVAPAALLLAADPDGNIFTGQTLGPNSGDVML